MNAAILIRETAKIVGGLGVMTVTDRLIENGLHGNESKVIVEETGDEKPETKKQDFLEDVGKLVLTGLVTAIAVGFIHSQFSVHEEAPKSE